MHGFYQTFASQLECYRSRDITFMAHLHRQVEVVLVTEGEVALSIGGQQRTLAAGEAAVVFPDVPHRYTSRGRSVCLLLIFDPELAGGTLPPFGAKQPAAPFLAAEQVHPDVRQLMGSIAALERPAGADPNLLRGAVLVIMSHLAAHWELREAPRARGSLLEDVLGYLNGHFKEPLSLDVLAQELGASKYHLSRLFARQIGCGLNAYLNTLRCRYACALLEETDRPVTEVAHEAGFESQSTFYRLFRQHAGTTPTAYREKGRRTA